MAIRIHYNSYEFKYPEHIPESDYHAISKNYETFYYNKMQPLYAYYKKYYRFYVFMPILILFYVITVVLISIIIENWKYINILWFVGVLLFLISMFTYSLFLSAMSYKDFIKSHIKYYKSIKNIEENSNSYSDFSEKYQHWIDERKTNKTARIVFNLLMKITKIN